MVYLNPERLTDEQRRQVDAWLVANGCRHHVAIEPVIVKGGWIEYVALFRRDSKSARRAPIRDNNLFPLGTMRIRHRVPLSAFLPRGEVVGPG